MSESEWLSLFDGTNLSKWTINGLDNMELCDGVLVIGEEPVDGEVGGPSWNNFIMSADVMVTRKSPEGWYCVQLTADGTCIYCQMMPGAAKLAYFRDDTGEFANIVQVPAEFQEGTWLNFQMTAAHDELTASLNGKEIVSGSCPRGTDGGFPGFIVNQVKQCEVRLRNIRIKFLEATDAQLEEYEKDAGYNWLRQKENRKIAQQRAGDSGKLFAD